MTTALTLIGELRSGSSLPLLVDADDGARYVVKAHGSGDGMLAGAVDWLALRLGGALGLPTVAPVLVALPDGFAAQAPDPEVRELIERSPGGNFATRWLADAAPLAEADIGALAPALRDDLFLFDLWLLNIDRSVENPNALLTPAGLRCLDYAAAMALRACVLDDSVVAQAFLPQIRRNPFYRDGIDADAFIARVAALPAMDAALAGLPDAWLAAVLPDTVAADRRMRVAAHLAAMRDGVASLRGLLSLLRTIEPESAAARRARANASKAAFAQRHGGFHRGA